MSRLLIGELSIPTLQGMGVDYVKGSLDSRDLLIKTVLENEVVIHAAYVILVYRASSGLIDTQDRG